MMKEINDVRKLKESYEIPMSDEARVDTTSVNIDTVFPLARLHIPLMSAMVGGLGGSAHTEEGGHKWSRHFLFGSLLFPLSELLNGSTEGWTQSFK